MDSNRDEILKNHLYTIFFIFKDKYHILVKNLIEQKALSDDFKDRVITNETLKNIFNSLREKGDFDIPYFKTITDLENYFKTMFTDYTPMDDNIEMDFDSTHFYEKYKTNRLLESKDTLLKQLQEAIDKEEYEKAAFLRDYIKNKGY
jgi:hypothetical protein